MRNFLCSIFNNNKNLWLYSTIISAILLTLVITQLDIELLTQIISHNLNTGLLFIAILCLSCEGIATAFRIKLFTIGGQSFNAALYANAWYVFFLIFLPARLGEFAAIFILQKFMHQSRGACVMNIVLQRILDLIILSSIFIVLVVFAFDFFSTYTSISISVALIIFLSILYKFRLVILSNLTARMYRLNNIRRRPFLRAIFRTLLQARLWDKQFSNHKLPMLVFVTIIKWFFNLSAITLIFLSISAALSISESALISVLYNFLAVIPIQTIGGIGIGEAGLSILLVKLAGLSTADAVAISIFTRVIILLFPFFFFVLVYSYNKFIPISIQRQH